MEDAWSALGAVMCLSSTHYFWTRDRTFYEGRINGVDETSVHLRDASIVRKNGRLEQPISEVAVPVEIVEVDTLEYWHSGSQVRVNYRWSLSREPEERRIALEAFMNAGSRHWFDTTDGETYFGWIESVEEYSVMIVETGILSDIDPIPVPIAEIDMQSLRYHGSEGVPRSFSFGPRAD